MSTEGELPVAWLRDPTIFEAAYREHAPRIRAFLRQMVGSRQAAEDVTQELFTQLWLRPGGFDPDRGMLSPYLFGATRDCKCKPDSDGWISSERVRSDFRTSK